MVSFGSAACLAWDGLVWAGMAWSQVLVRGLPGVGHGVLLSSCLHICWEVRGTILRWYSLTHCTGGTVWHTLVVQFDTLHWCYSLVRWLPEGGLVPTRIKIGAHTLANIHHGDADTSNLLDQQQKRQAFIQGLLPSRGELPKSWFLKMLMNLSEGNLMLAT